MFQHDVLANIVLRGSLYLPVLHVSAQILTQTYTFPLLTDCILSVASHSKEVPLIQSRTEQRY